jgi:hypothetical protein
LTLAFTPVGFAKEFQEKVPLNRKDLQKIPENGWLLLGLRNSLIFQGKKDAAGEVKKRLKKAWAGADIKISSSRF